MCAHFTAEVSLTKDMAIGFHIYLPPYDYFMAVRNHGIIVCILQLTTGLSLPIYMNKLVSQQLPEYMSVLQHVDNIDHCNHCLYFAITVIHRSQRMGILHAFI